MVGKSDRSCGSRISVTEFNLALDGVFFGGHCTTGSQTARVDDEDRKKLDIILDGIPLKLIRMVFREAAREGIS